MKFKNIEFYNFRNIKCGLLDTSALDIVLLGINGQGKTNILEAIYLLCYGTSFRTKNLKDLITHDKKEMRVSAEIESDKFLYSKIDFIYKDGNKKILLDDKVIKDRKELIYNFPCIIYSHEDIDYIKGEPENRRNFFDQMITLYNPIYLDSLRRYYSVLKQRNAAIKNNEISLLQFYNFKLASFGLDIMNEREAILKQFNLLYPELYKKISDTDHEINIKYKANWKDNNIDEIIKELESNLEKDIKLQTTSSGIHRDKFLIYDKFGPFINTGSTGQIRLASLLLRIAEGVFFNSKTNKKLILLIDDVLLELDNFKRARFLNELMNYDQAFYTFLPEEKYFDVMKTDHIIYNMKNGSWNENIV